MPSVAEQDHFFQKEYGHYPSLPPPPGQVTNFVNPYSRAWLTIMGVSIILPTVTIFVLLRLYTKARINKFGLGKEDYACFLGYAGLAVYDTIEMRQLKHGLGVHQYNVPVINGMHFAQFANYLSFIYAPTIFFTKLSLLLSFLKLFAPIHQGATYWLCHITIWFNAIFYAADFFLEVFQCWPTAKIWDPWVPGRCIDPFPLLVITSAINAVTDVFLFILPIFSVWKLQLTTHQKIGVSTVFIAGILACACSVARFADSIQFLGKSSLTSDMTYKLVDQGQLANGEIGSALIAGCMLSVPQFFRHVKPKLSERFSFLRTRTRTTAFSDSTAVESEGGRVTNKSTASHAGSLFRPTGPGFSGDYMELDEAGETFKFPGVHSKPV